MHLNILLDQIREKACKDADFKARILDAYLGQKSIVDFCRECNKAGIEIYPMDIADADESAYAAMRRSTNGGGENSPHLSWEENIIEEFVRELQ